MVDHRMGETVESQRLQGAKKDWKMWRAITHSHIWTGYINRLSIWKWKKKTRHQNTSSPTNIVCIDGFPRESRRQIFHKIYPTFIQSLKSLDFRVNFQLAVIILFIEILKQTFSVRRIYFKINRFTRPDFSPTFGLYILLPSSGACCISSHLWMMHQLPPESVCFFLNIESENLW